MMTNPHLLSIRELPLVSLVTPAYNQAAFLIETIESVLAQDYPLIEYFVIDDGSTDNTPAILQQYSDRLTTFTQNNMGQARTVNTGWSLSSGKYIGYLSSDDILYPGAVTCLVKVLENNSDAVAAYPNADTIDYRSRTMKRSVCRPFDYDHLVVSQECFIGPGALFRRSAYEKVGGWRDDLGRTPDREFWMRLGLLGDFVMLPQAMAGYRLHSRSTSFREDNPEAAMEYVRVTKEFFDSPLVPERLRGRRDEAMGFAYLVVARTCFRAGRFRRGLEAFNKARSLYPSIMTPRVVFRQLRSIVGRPIRRTVWKMRGGA